MLVLVVGAYKEAVGQLPYSLSINGSLLIKYQCFLLPFIVLAIRFPKRQPIFLALKIIFGVGACGTVEEHRYFISCWSSYSYLVGTSIHAQWWIMVLYRLIFSCEVLDSKYIFPIFVKFVVCINHNAY